MSTQIALFRGINVGGNNPLPMRELVEDLEALGLKNVSTYIQSGNVVFECLDTDQVDLAARIQSAVGDRHGFKPHVMILGVDELEDAVISNPFRSAESEPKTIHLFFLESSPEDPDVESLRDLKLNTEDFELKDRIFYLHAPEGIGRSKLAARVERALGVPVTARNWRSVVRILDMAKACR